MYIQKKRSYFHLFLLLFFVVIATSISMAGQDKIDSLKVVVLSQAPDIIRLDAMIALAWDYLMVDHHETAELAHQIIILSQELQDLKSEALGYNLLGNAYYKMNHPSDSVMIMYDKAYEIVKEINDTLLEAKILSNKAVLYQKIGLDDQAFELYSQALKIAEEKKDKLQICRVLNNIASLLKLRLDDNDRALIYYLKALKIAEELEYDEYIARINHNIGEIYSETNKKDTALICYEKALEIRRKIGDDYSIVETLGGIGSLHMLNENYELGENSISEAYSLAKDRSSSEGQNFSLSLLAYYSVYYLEKPKEGIKYAIEGLKIIEETGDVRSQINYYTYLKDAYFHLGNYQEAFEAQNNYYVLYDSIYNIDRESHINNLLVKYETQQKEAENKILSITVAKQKNQQYALVAFFLASVSFLIAFILIIKMRQINKIEQMRIGIAQDLHDEVGSKLTLIQIYINKMLGRSGDSNKVNIVESGQEINKVIKDTHFTISDLVWAISPETNTMKDLINRLNDYADDFLEPTGIAYDFDATNFDKKLDPGFRQNIVLIFKEALNNILKHTNSSFIHIKLFNTVKTFHLEIINDFDSKKEKAFSSGNGLRNMQHRAKLIGGHIKIEEQAKKFKISLSCKTFG